MKIEAKKLDTLIPYENNPRVNALSIENLARSIEQFGFVNPIITTKENIIVAGHTRYLAAKELGLKEVPCIVINQKLTDEQVRAFRLADNKVSEKATWDYDKLREELNKIIDIDMDSFGFKEETLDDIDLEFPDEGNGGGKKDKTVICPHCGKATHIK